MPVIRDKIIISPALNFNRVKSAGYTPTKTTPRVAALALAMGELYGITKEIVAICTITQAAKYHNTVTEAGP